MDESFEVRCPHVHPWEISHLTKGSVGGNERSSLPVQRNGGQYRVESTQGGVTLEELEAERKIIRAGYQDGERHHVVASQCRGIGACPPAGTNVRKLLDNLDRGSRLKVAVVMCLKDTLARHP